jgi:hypothetical protein
MGFNVHHKVQEYLCSIQGLQTTLSWKPLPAKQVQEFDKNQGVKAKKSRR